MARRAVGVHYACKRAASRHIRRGNFQQSRRASLCLSVNPLGHGGAAQSRLSQQPPRRICLDSNGAASDLSRLTPGPDSSMVCDPGKKGEHYATLGGVQTEYAALLARLCVFVALCRRACRYWGDIRSTAELRC